MEDAIAAVGLVACAVTVVMGWRRDERMIWAGLAAIGFAMLHGVVLGDLTSVVVGGVWLAVFGWFIRGWRQQRADDSEQEEKVDLGPVEVTMESCAPQPVPGVNPLLDQLVELAGPERQQQCRVEAVRRAGFEFEGCWLSGLESVVQDLQAGRDPLDRRKYREVE